LLILGHYARGNPECLSKIQKFQFTSRWGIGNKRLQYFNVPVGRVGMPASFSSGIQSGVVVKQVFGLSGHGFPAIDDF
jgi:hypothetical protein